MVLLYYCRVVWRSLTITAGIFRGWQSFLLIPFLFLSGAGAYRLGFLRWPALEEFSGIPANGIALPLLYGGIFVSVALLAVWACGLIVAPAVLDREQAARIEKLTPTLGLAYEADRVEVEEQADDPNARIFVDKISIENRTEKNLILSFDLHFTAVLGDNATSTPFGIEGQWEAEGNERSLSRVFNLKRGATALGRLHFALPKSSDYGTSTWKAGIDPRSYSLHIHERISGVKVQCNALAYAPAT